MFGILGVLTFSIIAFGIPFALQTASGQPQTREATPVYTLIVTADQSTINPGDRVQISLYILGTAPMRGRDNRLMVFIPPILIQEESKESSVTLEDFGFILIEDGTMQPSCQKNTQKLPYSFVVEFDEYAFLYRQLPQGKVINSSAYIECYGKSHPPYTISFVFSRYAPSGQHNITLIFPITRLIIQIFLRHKWPCT